MALLIADLRLKFLGLFYATMMLFLCDVGEFNRSIPFGISEIKRRWRDVRFGRSVCATRNRARADSAMGAARAAQRGSVWLVPQRFYLQLGDFLQRVGLGDYWRFWFGRVGSKFVSRIFVRTRQEAVFEIDAKIFEAVHQLDQLASFRIGQLAVA